MNQLVQMFKNSNERMKQIVSGRFNPETIDKAQREAEIQNRMMNQVVQIFAITEKNKRAWGAMKKMNLIDDTTAVDLCLGSPEVDKVVCPYHDNPITRSECLDDSGKAENMERCQGCETGAESKRMLLPRE